MVDSINPLGQAQSILSTVKSSNVKVKDQPETTLIVDDLVISEEALNLSQAEIAAKKVSQELSRDREFVLSSDIDRLKQLI